MNREILFRGKSVDNGEWVYGTGISKIVINTHETNRYNIINNCDYDELDYFVETLYDTEEVIPETVSQYTGLTDKNGKKIFEGDMLKSYYDKPGIVKWNNEIGAFQIKGIPSQTMKRCYQMEVIGNIFDKEVNQ